MLQIPHKMISVCNASSKNEVAVELSSLSVFQQVGGIPKNSDFMCEIRFHIVGTDGNNNKEKSKKSSNKKK